MNKTTAKNILLNLEYEIINSGKKVNFVFDKYECYSEFPKEPCVILFIIKNEIIGVSSTGNGYNFIKQISDFSYKSSNTIQKLLKNFDKDWINSNLILKYKIVHIGKSELKDSLIKRYSPKDNCEILISKSKEFKQSHEKSYEPWNKHDDNNLELLYNKGLTLNELSKKFKRSSGAIKSRIKKLELLEKHENPKINNKSDLEKNKITPFGVWFSEDESAFLEKWYDFYSSVIKGSLPTESTLQEKFVKIFNEKILSSSVPITFHSKAYQNLNIYQKTLIRYHYIDLHKEKIWNYIKSQGSDSIYYLSKAQLTFAKKIKLPNYLKNAEHYISILKKHDKI